MGIEIINSPPLVAAAGVASHAAFPALEKWVQDGALSWNALRMVNLFTFTLHMIAVSIPGRIDERKTTEMSTGKKSIVDDDIDNSLFTPAPW